MEYKHSTFQLGLQARNVNNLEKNHNNGSYWMHCSSQNRLNVDNKEKTKIREQRSREENKRDKRTEE